MVDPRGADSPDRGPPSERAAGDGPGPDRDASASDPDGSARGSGRSVTIRPLREDDLPQVTAIEEASFATPWSDQTFSNLLKRPNACLLSAVDAHGRVLGYAAVWFAGDEGELGDIAVEPVARRRGIGAQLLRAILEQGRARGARQIFLEVREGNWSAQSLYRKHRFEVVGRRPDYYTEPTEDALVMRCLLVR